MAIVSYLLYFFGGWIVVFMLSDFVSNVIGIGYSVFIALLLIVAAIHLVIYQKVMMERYLAWIAIVLSVLYFFMIFAA